jgi:hypothetical protein
VLPLRDPGAGGELRWRRYPSQEEWRVVELEPSPEGLRASIPHQPPAGKVEYRLVARSGGERVVIPDGEAVVARYRGEVPASVLLPHILAIFASMLLATRALLEVLRRERDARLYVVLAMGLLVVGGLILGPMVQKHAFGAYWTGWPHGTDLTDNKTAVAFLAWLPATVLALLGRPTRVAVVAGWLVMMAVFLIPHSFHGSEIDWSTHEAQGAAAPSTVAPEQL